MAQISDVTGTGSKEKFLEALKESLSGFNDWENNKNILPIAYDILAEKLAEVDRVWSANKNDNYLSIPVLDEVVIRSESAQDRLSVENVFAIDRVGNTSSTETFSDTQYLSAGTSSILLANVPSDPFSVKIVNVNSPVVMASQVSVLSFDASINSITIQPIPTSGYYRIEYTTTGNVFSKTEEQVFGSAPEAQLTLSSRSLVFGSEKIFPLSGVSLVRDVDYVINYPDGVVDFLDIDSIKNRTIIIQYNYQRDLLKDVLLFSHLPVRNEIAFPSIENPYLLYTLHQPIQDVTRVQNLTTGETYNILSANKNEIRISGNRPTWTVTDQSCTDTSETLDFTNERYSKTATVAYPDGISPLNYPLVSINSLTITTKAIRLTVANQVVIGTDSTAYRRVYEDNTLPLGTTSIILGFVPQNFTQVVLYRAADLTKTNLIAPSTFNITNLELSFVTLSTLPLPADDYIVRYDTLQWVVYCGRDVSTLNLTTGGVLLRNAVKRLKENTDYILNRENDKFRITFTAQGAANIGNGSSFYTLTKPIASFETTPYNLTNPGINEPVIESPYPISYTEFLKTETIAFTSDPLDLISLIKLERFRDRGPSDILINPVTRVFSLNGSIEYVLDTDYVVDYANKTIKRIDSAGIQPGQSVKIFYEDVENSIANFTYVSDLIQIDYEYGDNAVDHSPTIVDTPVTRLEALRAGVTELKLTDYPANYQQVQISNTLYPEIPAFFANGFNPTTGYLSFPAIPQDGTYLFQYTARAQLFSEGVPYYVSYRYGARRDRLQNYFAYLRNLDIGQVFRQDEVALMSDQVNQQLLYHPLNFYDVKIYAADDNTQTAVTKVTDYNSETNIVTFDPIENAGNYIFEYYTFNRDVEQLRKGLVGLSKAMPQVPTVNAFNSLLGEYTATAPEIANISDKRFQIRKRIKTTEVVNAGQTYLPISNVSNLPSSGTAIVYGLDNTTETITYSFISGKQLDGIPVIGYGSITLTHPIGARVIIQNNELGTYNLNPLAAVEADPVDGVRAVKFVSSRFAAGMACDSTLKGWVRYKTVNNVNINEGTLSFWTGIKYDGSDGNTHYYVDLASPYGYNKNRLSIYKSSKGYLQFEIRDATSRLMSIRVDVRRGVTEETIWLDEGQTEVSLSQIPSYPVDTADVQTIIVKTPSGAELTAYSWDQETKQLLIEAAPIAGYYFFSYVTGFVNFDETDHFIEATWKIHTNDGTAPRLRLYVDGVKYEQQTL